MDLTKWIPLWDRCPGLRPECLCTPAPKLGEFWTLAGAVPGNYIEITDENAFALIRDKAVWWLAENVGFDEVFRILPTRPWLARRGMLKRVSINNHPIDSDDPTESLYLACCKVLGVEI